MIHHVSVGTNDLPRSKLFYDAVLPVIGIRPMSEEAGGLGCGHKLEAVTFAAG